MFTVKSIRDFLQDLPDDKPVMISYNQDMVEISYIDNDNEQVIMTNKPD